MKIEIKSTDDLCRIRAGLKLYARNARAASGTLKGLGKEAQATALQEEADDTEQRLMAQFDEQGSLPLAGDGAADEDATPATRKRK